MKANKHCPRGIAILHDDRDIYVINKNEGILTTGTGRKEEFTAEKAMSDYFRKGNHKSSRRVYLVHRIDRETSGLLLFAKSEIAQQRLKDNWSANEKFYLAAVHGHLKEAQGSISSYLAESETFRVFAVTDPEQGRLARCTYAVIATTPKFSLVKVRLLTGRKHQIRVHFADLGNPVYGDPRYGPKETQAKRLYLHAKHLAFNHPHSGERLTFNTAIPPVFSDLFRGFDETAWEKATPPEERLP